MFKPDRIFFAQSPVTGKIEWFFQAREGYIGPYETKEEAEQMLKRFVQTCIDLGQSGGRKPEDANSPEALQLQNFLHYELKGDLHWI